MTTDPEVLARWRLTLGPQLGARSTHTWAATRDGRDLILQRRNPVDCPDWPYTLRVAAALREQGWPTPELAEEPLVTTDGVWLLSHRRPGRPPTGNGPDEQRLRGRLLAELHQSLAGIGIREQRGGYGFPGEMVRDPALERTLAAYADIHPADGAELLAGHAAAVAFFAANPEPDVPAGVIHGDFTPWNLLFEDGRLTGVLDFEITHVSYLVADFALSWRGYQSGVISGYEEVRPLSEVERALIVPTFQAWCFLGLAGEDAATLDLSWNLAHLRRGRPARP
ncbi:phosphotransferase enzyme family protein [Actinoplanes sp. HUAS TT8]|uniref:phosphotransferase enzyme family protein n=1 Tax=Actinoplanes sp. HUAS TT8 TaxID=3447453 RepID=UPI003F52111D